MKRIYIVGSLTPNCLEISYQSAFQQLGYEVRLFDLTPLFKKYTRGKRVGSLLNTFFPVDSWAKKVNKDLVLDALAFQPHALLVGGNARVLAGSLAFLKSVTNVKTVLLWPDPLVNIDRWVLHAAPMYDLVATFNKASIDVLQRLGFPKAGWLPFAADKNFHYGECIAGEKPVDISFVGSWRPEREQSLSEILAAFPGIKMKILGPDWDRAADKQLKKFAVAKGVYGKDFIKIVQQSLMNLNVNDAAGYPAANMRFFEIPIAGGFQLSSATPDMYDEFKNYRELLYFSNKQELLEAVKYCLANREAVQTMAQAMHNKVLNFHTYEKRAAQLIEKIS